LQPLLHIDVRVSQHGVDIGGAHDRVVVAAHLAAVPGENLRLAGEFVGGGAEVGVLGIIRGDLQRHLLAATGDPQRDSRGLKRFGRHDGTVDLVTPAIEGDIAVPPCVAHYLNALVEPGQPDPC